MKNARKVPMLYTPLAWSRLFAPKCGIVFDYLKPIILQVCSFQGCLQKCSKESRKRQPV